MVANHRAGPSATGNLITGILADEEIFDRIENWILAEPARSNPLRLRISHQPNFLAYWRLIGQFALAGRVQSEFVRRGYDVKVIYVANDYDSWDDQRFKSVRFPTLGAGSVETLMTVRLADRQPNNTVIARLGPLSRDTAEVLANTLIGATSSLSGMFDRAHRRILRVATQDTIAQLDNILRATATCRDFCVAYLRDVARAVGIQDMEVVSGLEAILGAQSAVIDILRVLAVRSLPAAGHFESMASLYWAYCSTCGVRWSPVESTRHRCGFCGMRTDGTVIPKVLADELLDDILFPHTVAFSHFGGLAHTLLAHQTRRLLELPSEFLDICSFQGSRHDRLATELAAGFARKGSRLVSSDRFVAIMEGTQSGSFSSLYYLISDLFESML